MVFKTYKNVVYMATHVASGKAYIGKTTLGMHMRRLTHLASARSGGGTYFLNSLRKHGPDAFIWCEIYVGIDDESVKSAEMALISDYRAAGVTLYNLTDGGDGTSGRPMPDHVKAILAESRTPERDEKIRASWTPERRAAQAEKMAKRHVSEETRAKSKAGRLGMKLSPEHCANIGKARKGKPLKPWTEERRAKMEAAWAKRKADGTNVRSEETRRKQSEAAKRRFEKAEERAKASSAGKAGAKARWG